MRDLSRNRLSLREFLSNSDPKVTVKGHHAQIDRTASGRPGIRQQCNASGPVVGDVLDNAAQLMSANMLSAENILEVREDCYFR